MATHKEQLLKPWNQPLGLSFHFVADMLAANKTARDTWLGAAIKGHSSFSKAYPLSVAEEQLLAQKGIYTVSQIMEVDVLTDRQATGENRALMMELAPFLLLQHKLRLLLYAPWRGPTVL
jgi:hypothetical protein